MIFISIFDEYSISSQYAYVYKASLLESSGGVLS